MANYGYIYTKKRIDPAEFANLLRSFAMPKWRVALANFRDGGPTWIVDVPGTALPYPECNERCLAPNENTGFAVSLQDNRRTIAFRHCPNSFENWAQGCMEEELSDHYKIGVTSDATGETRLGSRIYRSGSTFFEYLSRNFTKPLSDDDQAYLDRFLYCVPAGFDTGFTKVAP
jgi:hypothetical protein